MIQVILLLAHRISRRGQIGFPSLWGMSPPKAKGFSQAMGELPLWGEGVGGGGVSQGPNSGQSLFLRNALRDDHLGRSFFEK